MSYVCKVCGGTHEGLPDTGFKYPDHYFDMPENILMVNYSRGLSSIILIGKGSVTLPV